MSIKIKDLFSIGIFCNSLLAMELNEIEYRVPSSWEQAAVSWGMSLEDYVAEANKILAQSNSLNGYEDLIPLSNPYTTLDANVQIELRKAFPNEKTYVAFIETQQQASPKFTIAK